MHYCSMITYFKSFQWQVKRAGMFTQIIVNGSSKIPPKSWTSLCSYLNAADNSLKLFDHCVYLWYQIGHGKSDRPCEGQTVVDLSWGEWILSAISGSHRRASNSALLRECMNELCAHTVSLESHKDNLVLCNLLCSAQVLVHVSTRGKTKVWLT